MVMRIQLLHEVLHENRGTCLVLHEVLRGLLRDKGLEAVFGAPAQR